MIFRANSASNYLKKEKTENKKTDSLVNCPRLIVNKLVKSYDSRTKAIDNLSFDLAQGEIVSLLGHNGAGKSTTLKIIASILSPTSGNIFIDNQNIFKCQNNQLTNIKRKLGYLPESPNLYSKLSAREYLTFVGELYGIKEDDVLKSRIDELIELFMLDKISHDFIETYSSGMQKRVALAATLINNSQLLLLDEPTNNLDPISSKIFKELLVDLKNKGVSILLATHHLEVAEKLSDRIAILENGNVIFIGTLKELHVKTKNFGKKLSLEKLYCILTN